MSGRTQTARVRRAAVRGLAKLDLAASADALHDRLVDEAPTVSAAARDALSRTGRADLDRVWAAFRDGAHPHVRRNALALLAGLPKWRSLPKLLAAARDRNAEVADAATERLERWNASYSRTYASTPSTAEIELARRELDQVEQVLPRALAKAIRFTLDSAAKQRG